MTRGLPSAPHEALPDIAPAAQNTRSLPLSRVSFLVGLLRRTPSALQYEKQHLKTTTSWRIHRGKTPHSIYNEQKHRCRRHLC